jgi:BioD-like phosphotransacetylase family protein
MKSSSIGVAFDLTLNLTDFLIMDLNTVIEEVVKSIVEIIRATFIKYLIP